MPWPVSGGFPGENVGVNLLGNGVVWAGNLVVNGPQGSSISPTTGGSAGSGVEWIFFASQVGPSYNSGGGTNQTGALQAPIVPPVSRVRWATVFGTFFTNSSVIIPTIASGGLPDTLSGGRDAVSGVIISGAIQGPVIGVQYIQFLNSGIGTANLAGPAPTISAIISGGNIGVLLFGT